MDIICDPQEIVQVAKEWQELAAQFRTPLLQYEWFAAAAASFCQPGELYCLFVYSSAGLSAIAPLVRVKKHGFRQVELLGASYLGEPSGLLYRDEEALTCLLAKMIACGLPMTLSRIGAASLELRLLRARHNQLSACLCRPSTGTPVLPITTSWSDFEATISPRHGYDLRRARKRAQQLGEVEFEMISPAVGGLDSLLGEIFRVEAAGWKGRQGTALLLDQRLRSFFCLYAHTTAAQGRLRLSFLRIGGQVAAVQLAVQDYNRFWVLKVGYDEIFSKCSPGLLLMHETIRHSFAAGLEGVEFLGSDAPWLHIWTGENHPYLTVHVYPRTMEGQFRYGVDRTATAVKKLFLKRS